jgi:hypothetical protein
MHYIPVFLYIFHSYNTNQHFITRLYFLISTVDVFKQYVNVSINFKLFSVTKKKANVYVYTFNILKCEFIKNILKWSML